MPTSPLLRWCSAGRLPERLWGDPDFLTAFEAATGSVATDMAALDVEVTATPSVAELVAAPDAPSPRHKAADAHDGVPAPIAPSDTETRTSGALAQPMTALATAEGTIGTPAPLPSRIEIAAPRRRGRRATDSVTMR